MQSTVSATPLSGAPSSLAAAFAGFPDPRCAASVRYPLPAILAMAIGAILANHLSVARQYGMASVPPARADPARLLAPKRGYWAIENRLHRCKDVNFGEDASLIHVGRDPR